MGRSRPQITDLFLVRHGRTDWNAEGRFQGAIERELDDAGIGQAEGAAEKLAIEPLSAIYSSHMIRARQTAKIIAGRHCVPIVCAYELREGTYGPIDGMMKEEFQARFAKELRERDALPLEQRFHYRLIDGAETNAEILDRVLPCLQTICKNHVGERIAVVTHGWVMRTLFVYLSRYKVDQVQIENGAILHLQATGGDLTIHHHHGIQVGIELD